MAIIRKTMILTGALKGKTVELNHMKFVKGRCAVREEASKMESLLHYFRTSYQIYCDGEVEPIYGNEPTTEETGGASDGTEPDSTPDPVSEPSPDEEPSALDSGSETDESDADAPADDSLVDDDTSAG